jgi:hypothetical protein
MAMIARSKGVAPLLLILLSLAAMPVRASLFSIAASGTVSFNDSGDATIPVGTPWSFQIIYDTAAPDLDFETGGSADPTFGRFTNTGTPPAMTFFHYQAGSYQVTLNDAADFGAFSNMLVTFTSIKGLDINLTAPALFPHLAGGAVGFHADFAKFGGAIFTSDALPTNTGLGAGSFDDSNVTLLPPAGAVTGSGLTSFTLSAVPVLAGDFNRNGTVGPEDYGVWKSSFGSTAMLAADGNGNHVVDTADYTVWRDHFGATIFGAGSGAAVSAAVPEPATLWMLVAGILVIGRRRARRPQQVVAKIGIWRQE